LPGPHAPYKYVEAIPLIGEHFSPLVLQGNIAVIDFSQTFSVRTPPEDYVPCGVRQYLPPEIHFDKTISSASDVWTLACLILVIRAGYPLFASHNHELWIRETVDTIEKNAGTVVESVG
jgi:serine/threonine protein kinase